MSILAGPDYYEVVNFDGPDKEKGVTALAVRSILAACLHDSFKCLSLPRTLYCGPPNVFSIYKGFLLDPLSLKMTAKELIDEVRAYNPTTSSLPPSMEVYLTIFLSPFSGSERVRHFMLTATRRMVALGQVCRDLTVMVEELWKAKSFQFAEQNPLPIPFAKAMKEFQNASNGSPRSVSLIPDFFVINPKLAIDLYDQGAPFARVY